MHTMLSSWPPARLLSAIGAVVLLIITAAVLIATSQPWLGISFAPNPKGSGIVVQEVFENSPNPELKVGDVVVGIAAGAQFQRLDSELLLENPRRLPTYAKYNQWLQQHAIVWNILVSDSAELVLMGGTRLKVRVAAGRPISTLPAKFWVLVGNGCISVLLVASIWVFRRKDGVTSILFLASVAFLISGITQALFGSRELTLLPLHFFLGLGVGYLATIATYYSLIVLIWRFPVPLRRLPVASVVYTVVLMFWANQALQIVEFPGQTFFFPLVLALVVLVLLSAFKLHFIRREAAARAAFLWFILTMCSMRGFRRHFLLRSDAFHRQTDYTVDTNIRQPDP